MVCLPVVMTSGFAEVVSTGGCVGTTKSIDEDWNKQRFYWISMKACYENEMIMLV